MFLMSLLPKASVSCIMTHRKASWSNSTVLQTSRFILFWFVLFHKKKCHQLFSFTLFGQVTWVSTGKSQTMRRFYFVTALENIGQLAKCVSVRCFAPGVPRKYRWARSHTGTRHPVSSEGGTHLHCGGGFRERMMILSKICVFYM